MLEPLKLGAREQAAVDDAGMTELVGDDYVVAAEQCGYGRQIGNIAGAVCDGVLSSEETGNTLLTLDVGRCCACQYSDAVGAGAETVKGLAGALLHFGVLEQAEVAV